MNDKPLLELRGVNKSFGVAHVLYDVDFAVYPGQVTALVGDNGAGKSTLVKIIAGIYGRDSGDYFFEGEKVEVHGPRDVAALGVEVVYQDLALCDNLDVVANMYLGREQVTVGVLLDERAGAFVFTDRFGCRKSFVVRDARACYASSRAIVLARGLGLDIDAAGAAREAAEEGEAGARAGVAGFDCCGCRCGLTQPLNFFV